MTDDDRSQVRVPFDPLVTCVGAVFRDAGLSAADAAAAAEALCWADLVGRSSHGLANLHRIYIDGLASGAIDARAGSEPVVDLGGVVVLDAHRSPGMVVGTQALDLAVERGRAHGAALVGVRESTHFGCAGYYAERGARAGVVTLAATNCGTQRIAPPPQSTQPMLGTNPISLGAPAGVLPPFVLDMSTTVTATSRIRQAAQRREQVPAGWLVDSSGRSTTDPEKFLQGAAQVLFLGSAPTTGAFKGYGLALAVDVLCGLLTGAAVAAAPDNTTPDVEENIGHLFAVIDPQAMGATQFESRAGAMLGALLACNTVDGEAVAYPGYHEARHAELGRDQGVRVDATSYQSLVELAERAGAAAPLPLEAVI